MEQRMTVCNMSIEGGARAGMIAPDHTTFEYLQGREHAPKGAAWDQAVARWQTLASDAGAAYDHAVTLDAAALEPMITYGTNPGMGVNITGRVPDPANLSDANQKAALDKALRYMGLQPGQALLGQKIDVVFIGSCTNSRISDLREAAFAARGPQGRGRRAGHGGARLAGDQETGGSRGTGSRVQGRRRGMARTRMQHVHRYERRSA
jgi:3-isopropylmalate/(R)-2-methylmalate dehydratase large subunit